MIATVPRMMARGRFRCGSLTSPEAKDRSAQPSYAQRMLTIARPIALSVTDVGIDPVKWARLAPWREPIAKEARTSSASAENFIHVAVPTIAAPTLAPRILAAAANAMA